MALGVGGGFQGETGTAGWLRLITGPLATEASWLLPLALAGLVLALAAAGRPWPLTPPHLALVLWGGWLLPEWLYFSFTDGLIHGYYLIMAGPPLAALVGAAWWAVTRLGQQRAAVGVGLALGLGTGVLAFQTWLLRAYPTYQAWLVIGGGLLVVGGVGLAAGRLLPRLNALRPAAWAAMALAPLIAPLVWSLLTTFNPTPNVALPRSGPAEAQTGPTVVGARLPTPDTQEMGTEALQAYLLDNTPAGSYLVATATAMEASPFILQTDRPVLTLGGFLGTDNIVDVADLATMTASGQLRFVLSNPGLAVQKPAIATWLTEQCQAATPAGVTLNETLIGPGIPAGGGSERGATLYDCAPTTG